MATIYTIADAFENFENSFPAREDPKKLQFVRGFKFGNVPGGMASNVIVNGSEIRHVNSVMNNVQKPSDNSDLSGVIRFRGRNSLSTQIPDTIKG